MNNDTKLKQPKKYTHNLLAKAQKNKQLDQQEQIEQIQGLKGLPKRKKIQKSKQTTVVQRKIIRKKNQPSALRLQAINQTFQKIQQNTSQMMNSFKIDKQLLQKFLLYNSKVKCKCQPGRNIKYYCLKCKYRNQELKWPHIQLPLQVTILHHTYQKINKSSILPMQFLSNQIKLQLFNLSTKPQQLLNQVKKQQTWILFPHKSSRKVVDIPNVEAIKNIVILDCTWFQTDQMIACLQKKGMKNYIMLEDYQSLYWRYNHHNDKALSSAEALVYFLQQYSMKLNEDKQKYDNILFLYLMNLKIIEESCNKNNKQGGQRAQLQSIKQLNAHNQLIDKKQQYQQQQRIDNS